MTFNTHTIIKTLIATVFLGLTTLAVACSSDNSVQEPASIIAGISIPNPMTVRAGETASITTQGAVKGDKLTLTGTKTYECEVTEATANSFSFTVPSDMETGDYVLSLLHSGKNYTLGTTRIEVSSVISVPDKAGMNVKGVVYCNGKGIEGVVVSDGIEVTTTDAHGFYYLNSAKKYGYVFISIPSGYEVSKDGNAPQFFKRISTTATSTTEEADFELKPTNNSRYAVLALADFHLANRNEDIAQFEKVAADINSTAKQLQAEGYKVYGLSLGDESWDLYWYSNRYGLAQAYDEMQIINVPLFHCMGNHDNDPYYADDFLAEQEWIKTCVPVYYSFNLGGTHYVVMDDIQYLNTGGAQGVIGKRNYNEKVIEEEMEWLRKDLATVADKKAPLVVAMHAPLYDNPQLTGTEQKDSYELMNAKELNEALAGFSNVQILTGHKHLNYNITDAGNITEHNTGAICATWWWTGKLSGNHICYDGTPGGYGVYTYDNGQLKWYYKSSGYDKDYQFRTYDLNTTYIDPDYAPDYSADITAYAHGYVAPRTDNEVLINVWNYDPQWKISVTENGKALTVTRTEGYDPLHILSYDAPRIKAGGNSKVTFPTELTAHLFKVKASSPTSTLEVSVTDRFGNVYKETMTRPKAFAVTMK